MAVGVAVATSAVAVAVTPVVVVVGTAAGAAASPHRVDPGGLRVSTAEGGNTRHVSSGLIGYGRSSVRALVQRLMKSWAARSLQVGALATVLDVCVLLFCKKVLKLPTPVGAAIGVAIGSTLAFFLNRAWAFRARGTPVTGQAVKFIISTLIAMSIHAPLVGILADWLDVPVVVAKLAADVLVFSIGQLLAMRFLIFRKSMQRSPQ
jgi:putative flippase GtrA